MYFLEKVEIIKRVDIVFQMLLKKFLGVFIEGVPITGDPRCYIFLDACCCSECLSLCQLCVDLTVFEMIVDSVPCVVREEMPARAEPFVAVDDYDTSIML